MAISPMKILVVDDEAEIRESLREIFTEEGYEVLCAEDEKTALDLCTTADLAIVDIKLGSDNGIDVLRKMKSARNRLPVIMITGFGTVALAKEAFKLGAHDFLEKPLRLIQVRTCVRNALEGVKLKRQLVEQQRGPWSSVIYRSASMKQLYSQAAKVASVKEPVVILGPSGSGKELLARFLHYEGPQSQGPFVATNAASMPVSLAEDELFGHEKGAFTGADRKREGCIEQANGGTLFLDEIADMDPQIQAKLLRVLENGEFMRLGGSTPVFVDIRIVCATHKDLQSLVNKGTFRHDLWYRISAFELHTPALDKRREDIPLLANHFLARICDQMGSMKTFTPAALQLLTSMDFPGNVRELKHLTARLAVYSENEAIDVEDIRNHGSTRVTAQLSDNSKPDQEQGDGGYSPIDFRDARIRFERDFLRSALDRHNGNISATAREIGMAQSNLSRKLKEIGM